MTVIKSYVVKLNTASSNPSTVVTDGVTIQGDGSIGSPLAVIAGVFDAFGAAAAGLVVANAYTDAGLATKQNTLVSGINIKTINGASILGSGNITISASAAWGAITGTVTDQADLVTYVSDQIYGYTPPVITVNNNMTVDGNSQDAGALLPSNAYRYGELVRATLGAGNYTYTNFGVGGDTTQQMIARQATTNASYNAAKTNNYLIAGEIENDAFFNTGLTASDLYNNMATYFEAAQTAGFRVIARTSPLRAYYGPNGVAGSLAMNKRIADANTLLLATSTSYDDIIDVKTLPRLSNTRSRIGFFWDDTHFNESGNIDLAKAVVSKIRAHLGQTDYTPPEFASYSGNTAGKSIILGTKDNYPTGLIANGKIAAEVSTYGSFIVNGDVTPSQDNYQYAVGQKQAAGFRVTPGLTATANQDILSAMTISPAYFDVGSFTGTITDMFRIESYLDNGYFQNLYRFGREGRITHSPTFTAVSADVGVLWGGTIVGHTSGTFTQHLNQGSFTFSANTTSYTAMSIAPNTTRGAFTGTIVRGLLINTGSNGQATDFGIDLSVIAGIGINMSNHAGTAAAINVVSSSTGSGAAIGMTAAAGIPLVVYKTTGATTNEVARFIHSSTTSVTSLTEMISWERTPSGGVGVSGGISFPTTLNTASGNRVSHSHGQFWTDVTNGAEISAMTWSTMVAGTLAERMRIQGANVSIGFGATPTALVHIGASTTARASLCVPHGTAPTSPVNGDIWTDASGMYVRINGVTKTITLT